MAGSLETNKILAALLTAGIFASGAGVVSRMIYHPTTPEEPSYIIEVAASGEDSMADGDGGEVISLAALMGGADVAGGEKGAKKCVSCHTFEEGGANKIGPNLYSVLGRDIASVGGFAYSDGLAAIEGNWDYESMDAFLAKPKDFAPGTKMAYAGMRSAEDRADLIMYLRSLSAEPLPLPEVEEGAGGESEAAEAASEAADAAEDVAAAATEAASDAADQVAETATEVVEGAEASAEAASEAVQEATEAATDAAAETVQAATDAVEDAAETATNAAAGAIEDATEGASQAAEAVTGAAATAVAAVSDAATEATAAAGDAASGLVSMIAGGDVAKGEKISKKCKACHVFEEGGKNRLGPALWGIVGRDIGSHDGYKYSGALAELEGDWTYENLDQFIAAPKDFVSGTKMVFAGIKSEEDRADLLAYLRTLAAEPAPLESDG